MMVSATSNVSNNIYYEWSLPNDWSLNYGQGSWYIGATAPYYFNSPADINLTVHDVCGDNYSSITVYPNGGYYYYMVSPNPASSDVTVSTKSEAKNGTSHNTISQINVYDQMGNLKKTQKFGKVKTATLNVSNLSTGIYIIEVIDGNYKERQQLSVLK